MDNTYVYIVGLPNQIREMVLPCADGYTIYINEQLNDSDRISAYGHAMEHIRNDDWNKSDVQTIEADAHKIGGYDGIDF